MKNSVKVSRKSNPQTVTTTQCSVACVEMAFLITMIALLEVMSLQRWEEVLELVCGAWVVAAPYVLGYGGVLRISHFVLGAAVVVLALLELWQDRNRQLAG